MISRVFLKFPRVINGQRIEVVNGKENEKLNYNIDPDEKERDSHVRKMFFVDDNSNFEKSKRKYRIHAEDRRIINNYKK